MHGRSKLRNLLYRPRRVTTRPGRYSVAISWITRNAFSTVGMTCQPETVSMLQLRR